MSRLQEIQPSIAVKLKDNEKVYGEFTTLRAGVVDSFKTTATGVGIGGALGHVGLGVGRSKGEAVSSGKFQVVDDGKLLFTNKRVIFIGQGFVEIPYGKINVINFKKATYSQMGKYRKLFRKMSSNPFAQYRIPTFRKSTVLSVLYEGGLKGEEYFITDKQAHASQGIYTAIANGDGPEPTVQTTSKVIAEKVTEPKHTSETKKAFTMPTVQIDADKVVSPALGTLKTIAIVFLVIFFAPIGIPLMYKFMQRPSTKAKTVIAVVWGLLWLIIVIGNWDSTDKPQTQSNSQQNTVQQPSDRDNETSNNTATTQPVEEKQDTGGNFTDALRKCTVMEAADIYTTGIGAKTNNAFNDARDTCNSMFNNVYNGDEALFISDVATDWKNRKSETIEGKNLEHYLSILGW